MHPFKELTSIAIPFYNDNIDTDVIIPARYLKTIVRSGLGKACFDTIRRDEKGQLRNSSPFDFSPYKGGEIMIVGSNFGCGSSREHAVWALMDMGVRCLIGSGFADIFYKNAMNNGMLLVALPKSQVENLNNLVQGGKSVHVDLEQQTITGPDGVTIFFNIESFRKDRLLNGLDEVDITLADRANITAHKNRDKAARPWLYTSRP